MHPLCRLQHGFQGISTPRSSVNQLLEISGSKEELLKWWGGIFFPTALDNEIPPINKIPCNGQNPTDLAFKPLMVGVTLLKHRSVGL